MAENSDKNVSEFSEKLMEIFGEKVLLLENRRSAKDSIDIGAGNDPGAYS